MMRRAQITAIVTFLLSTGVAARATSIVIDIKPDNILVVADSRARLLNPTSGDTVRDDQCKIIPLGSNIAFSETGREGYEPTGFLDPIPGWHGTTEALGAYNDVTDRDLYNIARDWSIRVADDFQRFYMIDAQRVRGLAVNGVLLDGIFVGTGTDGKLTVYTSIVAIDDTLTAREGAVIPIGYSIKPLAAREEPYGTNATTQELLDGTTNRAKEVARLWAKSSLNIPASQRRVRWLEFLVERTGDYDPDVHAPVNAIRITTKASSWIQNVTCQN